MDGEPRVRDGRIIGVAGMGDASSGVLDRLGDWLSGYPDVAARRVLHRAPVVLWRLGLGRVVGRPFVLLTTTGRASGLPRRTPLAAHRIGGRTYVWSPYGSRAHWFRNLAADPIVTVQAAEGTRAAWAERPTEPAEVAAVYARLLEFDPRLLRGYLAGEGIGDSVEDVVADSAALHVVRLDPTTEPGPRPLEADLAWVWLAAPAVAALWRLAARRTVAPAARG